MFALVEEQKRLALNQVRRLSGSGAPSATTIPATAIGYAGPGSEYIDITNNAYYINVGTAAVPIWLNVTSNEPLTTMQTVTTAQVNAGFTLVSAILGYKTQVVDCVFIANGGNASGATDVRLLGTQAAGSVALLIATIAALTRSARVGMGIAPAAGASTILADSASFAANDSNTAVTIGKTGGNLATATSVFVILTYMLVKG